MQSIRNILIANRGEIARRIIRTAKNMGIDTLAIYTNEERGALHVLEADKSVSLGSGNLSETYLNISLIIQIARENNCDAIHPGYGFLSENADFAQSCLEAGIIFIGPHADIIRLMGDKSKARDQVQKMGIPLIPSYSGNIKEVRTQILLMKFPLIIKAVAGGGGKGMKIINSAIELSEAWETATREAENYFGNSRLYLEQYIEDARHIEVQVLGDVTGNVIHLFDRECTIQRRHQKIIEEAPSVTLPVEVRKKLLDTAVYLAKSINYSNAGTIEFLFDKDLNFYFLEMNTRIQVEHAVTEAITGIDIVKEQILIAEGKTMSFKQEEIRTNGHAIECRIYAEDPFSGFVPSSGNVLMNHLPTSPGIRIDSAFDGNATVSSSFDPMIAKVISYAHDRATAISVLNSYFKKSAIHGIETNLEYLGEIIEDKDFKENNISTQFSNIKTSVFQRNLDIKKAVISPSLLIAIALAKSFSVEKVNTVWQNFGPWRNIARRVYSIGEIDFEVIYSILGKDRISFNLSGHEYLIERIENQVPVITFLLNGEKHTGVITEEEDRKSFISFQGLNFSVLRVDLPDINIFNQTGKSTDHYNGNHILSPLNGKVIKLIVKEGDKVQKGELLLIIESMKMENKILSPTEAVIEKVMVSSGDQVKGNELLFQLTMHN